MILLSWNDLRSRLTNSHANGTSLRIFSNGSPENGIRQDPVRPWFRDGSVPHKRPRNRTAARDLLSRPRPEVKNVSVEACRRDSIGSSPLLLFGCRDSTGTEHRGVP